MCRPLAKSLMSFRRALPPTGWAALIRDLGRFHKVWGMGEGEIGFSVMGYSGGVILRGDDYSIHS